MEQILLLICIFSKITFGNSNADWGSKFLCSNQPCTLNPSESLLSTDSSKLYAIAAYGNPKYLHIFVLKVSDGSKADAWYISNTAYPNILNLLTILKAFKFKYFKS